MATTSAQAQTLLNLFLSFYGKDVIQQHQGNKYFPIGKQTTFEINSHRLIRNAPGHTATVTFTVPSWLDISLLSHQDARIVLHEGVPQADGLTKTYQVDLTNGFNGAMRFRSCPRERIALVMSYLAPTSSNMRATSSGCFSRFALATSMRIPGFIRHLRNHRLIMPN